jgi:hypothetical protein
MTTAAETALERKLSDTNREANEIADAIERTPLRG